MAQILAVSAQEYRDCVGKEPFIGLPREEIERLHDVIPVLAFDESELDDQAHLPLAAYAVVHHNYAWLSELGGPGTLGQRIVLRPDGPSPTFLDDALHTLARRQLVAAGLPSLPAEWRLAGLLNHGQLALVYVVRLHQRWPSDAASRGPQPQIRGNNDLRFGRDAYDAQSQLLIDHLHAL